MSTKIKSILKITSYIVFAVLLFIAGGIFSAHKGLVFLQDAAKTRHSLTLENSVDELIKVDIGGIEQTLEIRGFDKDAPILLFLHGGPGSAQIMMSHQIQTPLEEYFLTVQWDQRGAGKSYYPLEEIKDTMTIERMHKDTEEVVQYLRKRFNRDKIFVLGHSWGSVIGATIAQKRPEWFYAYIGMGQAVNMLENEKEGYKKAYELAKADNNEDLIKKLDEIAPYPNPEDIGGSLKSFAYVHRDVLDYYGEGLFHQISEGRPAFPILVSWMLQSRNFTYGDFYNLATLAPEEVPSYYLYDGLMEVDLAKSIGFDFDVPVFMLIGAHDWTTVRNLAEEYFDNINAPFKEKIMFENSGHMYFSEEPGKFFNVLVNKVLPLANEDKANDTK